MSPSGLYRTDFLLAIMGSKFVFVPYLSKNDSARQVQETFSPQWLSCPFGNSKVHQYYSRLMILIKQICCLGQIQNKRTRFVSFILGSKLIGEDGQCEFAHSYRALVSVWKQANSENVTVRHIWRGQFVCLPSMFSVGACDYSYCSIEDEHIAFQAI